MREFLVRFARRAGTLVPDATAMAIILLFVLGFASVASGNGIAATADAFYRGLWMLLGFSMQVVLMLVLASIVCATPLFRNLVQRLARRPRSVLQVLGLAVLTTSALSYLHWAIGVTLGPLIAVYFARSAEERGIELDFPCLLAAVFAAGSVWQFGLSSTGALLVATPGHFLEQQTGVMPLATTIWSSSAIVLVILFPLAVIALARAMMPREIRPLSAFPDATLLIQIAAPATNVARIPAGFGGWTERSRVFPLLLASLMLIWLFHHFGTKQASLDLNAIVVLLLLVAVVLQPSIDALSRALRGSVDSIWQVLILYQLYGGIAGMLQYTALGERIAAFFADLASPSTFPVITALAGTAIAIFVPSSGGQWIIQGFVTTETAAAVGASPQLGLLALGVGDQMGNLLSPFWVVIAASIARIEFRVIFGYCLIFAVAWFLLGVAAFTYL